jgi:GAF domain-containing protein
MLTWIKNLFSTPVLENEFQTQIARVLNIILLVILATTIFGTAILIPFEPDNWLFDLTFGLFILVTVLGLRRQINRGRLNIVIHLVALVIWIASTVLLLEVGTTRDASISAFFIVIAIASLAMEGRGAIVYGALTLLTSIGLIAAEMTGLITYTPNPTGIIDLFILATTIALTSFLGFSSVRGLNRGLKQAQENELAQIEANRELQAIRETLEQRVAARTADLERRALQLQAAAEVGRAAATIRDLDNLLTQVTHLINERFGFYHVGIFLLDQRREFAVLKAANSDGGQRMLAREHRLEIGQVGIVGHVVAQREPRVALDVGKDAVFFDNPDLPTTRSEMALPLIVGNEILGALDVQSEEEKAFTSDDITILQVLADQVAVAIESASLFAEQQETLESTVRSYGDISRASWKEFLSANPAMGFVSTSDVDIFSSPKEWTPEMIEATQKRDIVQMDDRSVAIPIILREQVLGVARFKKSENSHPWSKEELELLDSLTDQLEVSLESARLYRDTQRRAERERLVSSITTKIRSTDDPKVMLQTAVSELKEVLKADRGQMVIQPKIEED